MSLYSKKKSMKFFKWSKLKIEHEIKFVLFTDHSLACVIIWVKGNYCGNIFWCILVQINDMKNFSVYKMSIHDWIIYPIFI